MTTALLRRSGASFFAVFCAVAVTIAHQEAPYSPELPLHKGYTGDISGETIGYHSFHPYATQALLTRATDGTMGIEWETEPMPESGTAKHVTFVWIAGYSAGTSTGDRSFDLFINTERWCTFRTTAAHRVRHWTVPGQDGAVLAFDAQWEDQGGDLFGYMFLKVPAARFPKGRPLRLKVVGEHAGTPDWYMTFKYVLAESVIVKSRPALLRDASGPRQLIDVIVDHPAPAGNAVVSMDEAEQHSYTLRMGMNTLQLQIPAVKKPRRTTVSVTIDGRLAAKRSLDLAPVRFREFYLLPHSHNDIGYSDVQPDVAKKQIGNTVDALALVKKTASYPREAQFRWNVEILWGAEQFLQQASEQQKKEFADAVRSGHIGLTALYSNQLTGICRPEELLRLTDYARHLAEAFGVTVNSAMTSDIPGFSWSIVPALAHAGVKYFSSGPNFQPQLPDLGDRVGHSNRAWSDRPFYWVSPSGKEKILFWMAGHGYSWFHGWIIGKAGTGTAHHLFDYLSELEKMQYPYDMVQLRYTIVADNGPTDPDLPDFVRAWNERYVSPRLVIATHQQMFEEFERRHADRIPSFSGDLTPYWEDGAVSSLAELALVRHASERLVQAEALMAIRDPKRHEPEMYDRAWREVHLFDEHTWGAHNSVSEPESPFAVAQWEIKRGFALEADRRSRELLSQAAGGKSPGVGASSFDVVNTSSWPRTDLVTLTREQSQAGDVVVDEHDAPVPSQRLSTGELLFLARETPPLGGRRFTVKPGKPSAASDLVAGSSTLSNGLVSIRVDSVTGAIMSLRDERGSVELVDTSEGLRLNQYLYVPGRDPASALPARALRGGVIEQGPLVASLRLDSRAPGCKNYSTEIRLVAGVARVDIVNHIDKAKVREKEAIHIVFPFSIPDGIVRTDAGWGIVRPEADQLAGACRDYFSTQRWVDVSSQSCGVTVALSESPLIQVGEMTNEVPAKHGYRTWRKVVAPSTRLYSYVMNNYWHTNYKASQDGPVTVRYAVQPHGLFNAAEAYRFGIEQSHPLLVVPALGAVSGNASLFTLSTPNVVATSVKPCRDGKGVMVRLYNAGGRPEQVTMTWRAGGAVKVFDSSPAEKGGAPVRWPLEMPAFGIVTLRCEDR